MNKYILVIAICALASFSFAAMDTKSQFEQGMEAFKSGNYGSSELLFKKVKDTGEVEYMDQAWFHMALSIHNKKKYESALFEFKNFLNNCKNDDLASQSR
jgi:TolA-binding protein